MLKLFGFGSSNRSQLNTATESGFYKKPQYILDAAERKYGRDIYIVGATQKDIRQFWSNLSQHTLSATPPEEVGRTVVDIDSKCHLNQSDGREFGQEVKSENCYDQFEITSRKEKNERASKSYQLSLMTSKQTQFGANLNFKVGGAGFFNMASGVSPEVGGGGFFNRTKMSGETTTTTDTHEEALSQEYQIVDNLKVPPRTKVRAKIITYAVTYKSKTRVKLWIDAEAYIPVSFRTRFAQIMGGVCTSQGRITAEDLFVNEEEFRSQDGIVTFERDGQISYLGEEVEITKEKTTLPL